MQTNYWLKLTFFIAKVFFLKASFISTLMIVVNLLFFRSIQCCFVHLRFQGICLRCISTLKEERKYERVVRSCFFALFVLNLIVFVYNWFKKKPYSANKAKSFYRFLFCIRFLCLFFKKHLVLHIETWLQVCCCICHLCLHLLFCFANLC